MSEWKYKRWLAVSVILAALVWLVAFLLTTKPVQLWILQRAVGFEEVAFERGQLNWGSAYIEDIELQTAGIRLRARETDATFSLWGALLGHRDSIGHLHFRDARLRDVEPTSLPWPGRVLATLEDWRPRKDLLQMNALSLEGVWVKSDDSEVPLSLRAESIDFSGEGKFFTEIGGTLENRDAAQAWNTSGSLSWRRHGSVLLLEADGNATVSDDLGFPVTNGFVSTLRLDDADQSIAGKWINLDRVVAEGELNRSSPTNPFQGEVQVALDQRDLGSIWTPLKVFSVNSAATLAGEWNPEQGNGLCKVEFSGKASSFLLRYLGEVSLELESTFSYDLEGIVSEGLDIRLRTGRGELFHGSQSGSLSFPGLIGEEVKVALKLEKARMDWFSSRILTPSKYDAASWVLPEFSLEGGQDNGIWRFSVSPFEILDGEEQLAAVDKLLVRLVDANSSRRNLSFKFGGTMESGFLSEVLPNSGPFGVFDAEDARGVVSGEVLFSNEDILLRHGELDLASAAGGRQFRLRCENEINLDLNQPDFVSSGLRGELLSVQGNRLPMDGLIRWADGEVQGDAQAFSGRISRTDQGWVFRSDQTVEIGNARILRGEKVFGEELLARADLEMIYEVPGNLQIQANNLILEGDERSSLSGNLGLMAKQSDSGEFLATSLNLSELQMDLTTLTWLGFSEFPDLESGALDGGKLKATLGDEFSLEMDASLKDFRVVGENPMSGGLQTTVRSQPDGFSTWARLSLVRGNRESDATLDIFLPSDGNASRRKLSLSGEEFHFDELLAFASTIPAPDDRAALLQGQRFPGWARGAWELSFGELQVKGVPPFKEVNAKLFLQPRDLLLANATGKWLDGNVSADGSLSLGSPDEPGVRLQNFNARATQVMFQNLTTRLDGPVDGQLSGWAEGAGWDEAIAGFGGQLKVTASNGSLHFGPTIEKEAAPDSPKDPWSFVRLGEIMEGKASLSDSRKAILQQMDLALGDIAYDFVQIIGERAPDGNFTVSELSVEGESFKMDGKGKVNSFPAGKGGGALNLNLSVGARGELVDILQSLGVLAPIKAEGDYRMLKKDPLVVQGTMEKPDFSNFWALLAEGLGLGGIDSPDPN